MSLDFLTPTGALIALGVVVPLVAFLLVRRRSGRVRETLGLASPPRRAVLLVLGAMLAAAVFIGLAAAQPVLEQKTTLRTRTDVDAWVVLDVSRSMLARSDAEAPTRLERAKAEASALRSLLPEVPFGIATLTDRTLPHLFPSGDHDVFDATIARSVGIEQPPPRSNFAQTATSLDSLATIRTQRYFSPKSRKRVVVVLTDGESQPVSGGRLAAVFGRPPRVEVVFVHFWDAAERVFTDGAPEPQYRPEPSSRVVLDGLARLLSGSVYPEGSVPAVSEKVSSLVGSGPTVVRGRESGQVQLAPYLAAAALAPLLLLLWRRER
jgi:von Willebrand factor type A domain